MYQYIYQAPKTVKGIMLMACFLLMNSTIGLAQTSYEEGYFITNDGEKVACFIQNKDWKNNPKSFKYKKSIDADTLRADISQVEEFGIGNVSKYIRATVNIDRSSTHINKMSENRDPEWQEEEIFLFVVVEGAANLYMYEQKSLIRFFYNTKDTEIEPLIYKKYRENNGEGKNVVMENKAFLGQLNYALNCDLAAGTRISNLRYTEKALRNYFLSYNTCVGEPSVVYKNKSATQFNFKITPGVNLSSYTLGGRGDIILGEISRKAFFRLGLEAEFILPFNRRNWSIFLEPTFQQYKGGGLLDERSRYNTFEVDYQYMDAPIGLRHYFFLSERANIFVNAAFVLNFNFAPSGVVLASQWGSETVHIDPYHNFAFGVGYMHHRFSSEFRYFTDKNITSMRTAYPSNYTNMALIFGYRLF